MLPPFKARCWILRRRSPQIAKGPGIPSVTKCCLEDLLGMAIIKVLRETFSSNFSWTYNGDQRLGKWTNVNFMKHSFRQGNPRRHNKHIFKLHSNYLLVRNIQIINCNEWLQWTKTLSNFNYNDCTLKLYISLEVCTFLTYKISTKNKRLILHCQYKRVLH